MSRDRKYNSGCQELGGVGNGELEFNEWECFSLGWKGSGDGWW